MADKFDSSINIDTRLKTDGFKKGVKEIESDLKDLRKEVEEASESTESAGKIDTGESRKELNDLGKTAEDTAQRVEDALTGAGEAWDSYVSDIVDRFEGMAEAAREAGDSVERAGENADAFRFTQAEDSSQKIVVDTDIDSEDFQRGSEEMEDAIESLKDRFIAVRDELYNAMIGIFDQPAEGADRLSNSVSEAETRMHGLEDAVRSYKEAARGQDDGSTAVNGFVSGFEAEMNEIRNAPRITEMAMNGIRSVLSGVGSMTGGVMAQVSAAVNSPTDYLNQALGSISQKAIGAAGSLAQMAKGYIISGLKSIASHAKQAATSIASMAKNAVISGLNKLKSALSGVNRNMGGSNINFKKGLMMVLRYGLGIRGLFQLFRKLRAAISEGLNNVATYDTQFKATMDDFKNAVTTLKNAVGSAIAPIAQMVIPVITKIIYAITEGINKFGMLTAALTGAKTYLRATKAQTNAYQQEAKAAKEAQKTIAGFDDLVILQENEESSSGGADSGQPGGFETAPITDGINDLANALKDMWQKADFTDLGRMLGERLRDALNSIPWDSIKEVMRKIGKSIATFLNGFLETPGLFDAIGRTLAQALNSAFEFLNAFVSNFHWASLGQAIVDGLLGFLNNIDWALIQDTFAKLGAGIATTIGQIFSNPELPAKIGQALANVINTAFMFLHSFVTTLPWAEIGTFIKNGLLSLFSGIDWGLIYATFAAGGRGIGTAIENAVDDPNLWTEIFTAISKGFSAIFLMLSQFIHSIKWGSIGKNIGTGLNAGVEKFPWIEIAGVITDALNGIFDLIYNFITTTDFRAIGENVGSAISYAIGNFDWGKFGATFGALIQALFNWLNGVFETTDWKALGAGVMTAISGFFGEFDWASVGQFLSNLVTGLLDFLLGAAQAVDWTKVPGQVVDAISNFFSGIDWGHVASSAMALLGLALGAAFRIIVELLVKAGGAIYEGFKSIIDGGLQGIIDAIAGIGKWIVEHIFAPFIDGFMKAFGIASPSKEMEPLGGYIIEGLLGGILKPIKGIFKWLDENIASPIIGGVKKLFGIGSGKTALEDPGSIVTNGLKNGISGAMSGIASFIKGTVTDPVENSVKTGLGTDSTPVTEADGQAVVGGLKNGIGTGASDIGTYVDGTVTNPLITSMQNSLGTNGVPFSEADGASVVAGLKNGISGEANGIGSFVGSNVSDPVMGGITDNFGISSGNDARRFAEFGRYAMESMKEGIKAGSEAAIQTMMQVGTKLPTGITAINYETIGGSIPDDLERGIDNGSYDLETAASDLAGSLESPFNSISWWSIGDNIISGIYNGLSDSWQWLCDSAWNLACDVFDSACGALGISSPSKEFYWVAQMITQGMVGGLEDTAGDAVDAVAATADAVTREAEDAMPVIPIQTALDGSLDELDETMLNFADRIVGGFEAMVTSLQDIAGRAAFIIPRTAMGAVVPYSTNVATSKDDDKPDIETIMSLIAAQNADRLTREDLLEVLTSVAREYFNVELYLGDEQVARSANRGNVRLNRRFNTTN